MNLEDYLRSITPMAVLTFAILALAMAILANANSRISQPNRGKSQ